MSIAYNTNIQSNVYCSKVIVMHLKVHRRIGINNSGCVFPTQPNMIWMQYSDFATLRILKFHEFSPFSSLCLSFALSLFEFPCYEIRSDHLLLKQGDSSKFPCHMANHKCKCLGIRDAHEWATFDLMQWFHCLQQQKLLMRFYV